MNRQASLRDDSRPPGVFLSASAWQHDPNEDKNLFDEPCPRPEQMRIVEVLPRETRGACWAKSKALSLTEDEMATLGTYACKYGCFLLPRQNVYIRKSLIRYGEWQEKLNGLFAELISPGSTVVEIGAGFGAHTIPLARLAGAEGKEQSRRVVDMLHANIALSGVNNVQAVHKRMAALPGTADIIEPRFEQEATSA